MSNIGKASASIKKKLSFNDYSKPARQQESKPAPQPKGKQAHKHTSEVKPVSNHVDIPAPQQTVMPAKRQAGKGKAKATFYLGEQEHKMLTTLFINSLKRNAKVDKSALVCEAIRLLFERDK